MSTPIRDNVARHRFELEEGGVTAVANYTLADGVITFTHTETPPQARGRGMASRLVEGALQASRARGLRVLPQCSFVRAYLDRHPQFADLVA
jgi:uncharacterized protein